MNHPSPFQQMVDAYRPAWKGDIGAVLRCQTSDAHVFEIPIPLGQNFDSLGAYLATWHHLKVMVCNPLTGEQQYPITSRLAQLDCSFEARATDSRLTDDELSFGHYHPND